MHPLPAHKLLLGFVGHARRSWLRALQTSKVSSAPSCFTCPVAVDATTREVLPSALQVQSSGKQRVSQGTSQEPVLTSLATLPNFSPKLFNQKSSLLPSPLQCVIIILLRVPLQPSCGSLQNESQKCFLENNRNCHFTEHLLGTRHCAPYSFSLILTSTPFTKEETEAQRS